MIDDQSCCNTYSNENCKIALILSPPPKKKKKKNCYNQLFNEFNNFMPDLNILKILRTVNIMISVKQKA